MDIKINNKGFTLVELLAVIVILVSVSFIAVGSISKSLVRRDIKECEEQQALAVSAAKMYFSLDGKGSTTVTVGVLKNKGYFSDNKKTDLLNDGDIIGFTSSGYLFTNKDGIVKSCG